MDVIDTLMARGLIAQTSGIPALREAFSAGPVTFYIGFDPTADSLHVGHLVPVMAAAWLQRMGHRPIFIIGGGTAMIGDPSGRTEARQMLDQATIHRNGERFREQLQRFVTQGGDNGLILTNNADWLLGLELIPFLRDIGSHFSVNRMLTAEGNRIRMEKGLSFLEFNYQILQGYDFLELYRRHGCTLQVGGDDQWSNMLAGTELIRRVEGKDSHILTVPLVTTASGQKMGKTLGGAVWLDAAKTSPFDLYQYWLNVDDRDVVRFLKMYTLLSLQRIAELAALEGAEIREAKHVLAREFTALVHGSDEAEKAERGARAMASGAASADLPTFAVDAVRRAEGVKWWTILADAGLVKSRSEAKQKVVEGAVKLDHDKLTLDDAVPVDLGADGRVLRLGKSKAVRVVPG
jgi:tyrosyl-tRNA synthetase